MLAKCQEKMLADNFFPMSTSPYKTSVYILNQATNMEAMLVGFIAEKRLSLSLSRKLIELSKKLSKDEAARLSMHRAAAFYKLTYGLGQTFKSVLVSVLVPTPFTLNMDEPTSSNVRHVMQFFCHITVN